MIEKLTVECVDNGWMVEWWEKVGSIPNRRRKVFDNWDTYLTFIGTATGAIKETEFIEVFHHREDGGQATEEAPEPGTPDALVVELTPPGTPPQARGDT